MKVHSNKAFALVRFTVAGALITGATYLFISQPAAATPAFAAQTGKSCAECHQNPKGGGVLTPFGEQFKENGHKLPK